MSNPYTLSRRKALAGIGILASGAIGSQAIDLLQNETRPTTADPNTSVEEPDLRIGWDIDYYNWIDDDGDGTVDEHEADDAHLSGSPPTTGGSGDLPPVMDLTGVAPGDVVAKAISLDLQNAPGFLYSIGEVFVDSDEDVPEPEDRAIDGVTDGDDGTVGGDLGTHMNCVLWYDGSKDTDGNQTPGANNGLPDEDTIWNQPGGYTLDSRESFVRGLGAAPEPEDAFDTDAGFVIAAGSLSEVFDGGPYLLDPRDGDAAGRQASGFPGSACYQHSTVQYVGCACWLPRDGETVENLVQTDRIEYQLGFTVIQCENNVANDGTPLDASPVHTG